MQKRWLNLYKPTQQLREISNTSFHKCVDKPYTHAHTHTHHVLLPSSLSIMHMPHQTELMLMVMMKKRRPVETPHDVVDRHMHLFIHVSTHTNNNISSDSAADDWPKQGWAFRAVVWFPGTSQDLSHDVNNKLHLWVLRRFRNPLNGKCLLVCHVVCSDEKALREKKGGMMREKWFKRTITSIHSGVILARRRRENSHFQIGLDECFTHRQLHPPSPTINYHWFGYGLL